MAELVSLSITHAPNKARYVTGDKFERYGMLIRANYSDGTSSQIDDVCNGNDWLSNTFFPKNREVFIMKKSIIYQII